MLLARWRFIVVHDNRPRLIESLKRALDIKDSIGQNIYKRQGFSGRLDQEWHNDDGLQVEIYQRQTNLQTRCSQLQALPKFLAFNQGSPHKVMRVKGRRGYSGYF